MHGRPICNGTRHLLDENLCAPEANQGQKDERVSFLSRGRGASARHCQLSGPRAPFCGPARLERGSTIGEQRTFRPEPPRHRHNEHTTGG
jgi:hypothetical protein